MILPHMHNLYVSIYILILMQNFYIHRLKDTLYEFDNDLFKCDIVKCEYCIFYHYMGRTTSLLDRH